MQNITKTCCNLCTELGLPVSYQYGLYWLPTRGHCYRLNIPWSILTREECQILPNIGSFTPLAKVKVSNVFTALCVH